jgi:hypothetical protein
MRKQKRFTPPRTRLAHILFTSVKRTVALAVPGCAQTALADTALTSPSNRRAGDQK